MTLSEIVFRYVTVCYVIFPIGVFLAVRIGNRAHRKEIFGEKLSWIEGRCSRYGNPSEEDAMAFGAGWLISPLVVFLAIVFSAAYLLGNLASGRNPFKGDA